ncbi:nucleoside deaminase (cytosine deaminase, guanine deaminase) amidohydrolase,chlorohydrolase family protein [Haloferax mucosum ATCC BAA-1512]|uniref:Nucleoside deaminase (Cytosine deaminase, guanine deaminase) amidohydrolase,chlorohydrolase family protein n=1 Tax=Haloferax mucosum ATCC BAA-1512 TaxID=662479 RepID=M0ILJ4_9EURY|nr:amidohydrolase family protein [Haloferax mucosum]ELZ96728.1 nucleoside deaminase (cytosine deaminase, guanine deaminase) amidohydrolase,chlorohydrolase family protein [Haloferax mucosum ATCC BAA-1512]
MQLEGTVLRGRDFEPIEGRVVVEDGIITAIEEVETDSTDIILPAFVNAHTHLGDSIAKEAGGGLSLDELVAPPDGLKHRLLRAASTEEKVAAMHRSLRLMEQGGTATCLEFREGGVEGVGIIRQALDGRDIEAVVLGRETADAMEIADGFGASGARDAEFATLRNATAEAGKLFGIHAGERDAHDINPALDLEPDFLVHMVHPEPLHLERVADSEIPIVVCPRSNLVTGVGVPPVRELADRTKIALGTDNVMLNSPSMFREMEFTAKLADVSASAVLRMATVNGADIAGLNYGLVEEGREGKLLVLDGETDNLAGVQDVVRAVVRRAGLADVKDVYL